jgi:hypothetical protein
MESAVQRSALCYPAPDPGHQQEARISEKVKQVDEPAMRIITSPAVQLGLDLQFPALGNHKDRALLQLTV